MFRNRFYKDIFKAFLVICFILGLCRVTLGGAAALVAVLGVFFALLRKPGYMTVCYIMFPLFTIFNRTIVGLSPVFLMTARFGNLLMILAMLLTGAGFQGRAREHLPLGWMFVYCIVACISSIDGWMPMISFLKIAQFILFILGLLMVGRAIQASDRGLYQLRCAFMAMAIIFILGSFAVRFIPSVGYSMIFGNAQAYGYEMTIEDFMAYEGVRLFNGMVCHSQMLAPTVAIMATWVLCDMLLVERRLTVLHTCLLAISPILLFMSRSRGGFLVMVVVSLTVILVCVPRARLSAFVKGKLFRFLFLGAVLLVGVALVAQMRNQTISKWLRKTENVGGDTRSLREAFTASRQGLVEMNLRDFKLNPLLGKGFQVMAGMQQAYRAKMITWYSASVEKGVTPYVILGETGVVGAVVFVCFLISFYGTCLRRRYLALLTSFTCVLVANLADSTLFSPGGQGGFLWIVSCVGAFSTDLISIRQAHRSPSPGTRPYGGMALSLAFPPPGIPFPPPCTSRPQPGVSFQPLGLPLGR